MGEAAEASDDVPVAHRVVAEAAHGAGDALGRVVGQPLEERDAALLQGQVFGVLERHVEEHALDAQQLGLVAPLDGLERDPAGDGIAGEGPRPAAIHVAGELVEQDDPGQVAPGGLAPPGQPAVDGLLDEIAEALPDLGVERLAPAPPDAALALDDGLLVPGRAAEPELDHGAGVGRQVCGLFHGSPPGRVGGGPRRIDEARGAALEPRGQRLGEVGRGHGPGEAGRVIGGRVEVDAPAQGGLDAAHRDRARRRQPRGQPTGLGDRIVGHPGEAGQRLDRHRLAGQRQPAGRREADGRHQPGDDLPREVHAPLDLGQGQGRAGGRHPQIAGQREACPAADDPAPQRGEGRHRQLGPGAHQPGAPGGEVIAAVLPQRLGELGIDQISAVAEVVALGRQHHRPDAGGVPRFGRGVDQIGERLPAQPPTAQRHGGDVAVDVQAAGGFGLHRPPVGPAGEATGPRGPSSRRPGCPPG